MKYLLVLISVLVLMSCGDDPIPKPKAYFRIATPAKSYHKVDSLGCFSFEIPDYAFVKTSPDMPAGDRCWYNIYFPRFNAELYLTFKQINKEATLDVMMEDLYKTSFGHSTKAESITSKVYSDPANKKYGMIYDVTGNVASQMQFGLSDSSTNFVRGSLYFACTPNKDSLAPVLEFIHKDIDHIIETLRWK